MRALLLVVVAVLALGTVACEEFGDVDPVQLACDVCAMVEESGICEIIQTEQAERCGEGEVLVFTNLKAAVEEGVPLETACR
jgi:hypothetical protein